MDVGWFSATCHFVSPAPPACFARSVWDHGIYQTPLGTARAVCPASLHPSSSDISVLSWAITPIPARSFDPIKSYGVWVVKQPANSITMQGREPSGTRLQVC